MGSLPSIDFLKAQAERLTTYLGDKHRFRLKSASALEALAKMYQQPDWNTLQSLAGRDATSMDALCSPESFPLTWRDGRPDLTVNANDWYRHTLVVGGDLLARRTWLQQQLAQQLTRMSPGLFLNVFGDALPADLREHLNAEGLLIDLRQPTTAGSLYLNLLADLPCDVIGHMLIEMVYPDWRDEDAVWYAQVDMVLTLTAKLMREAGSVVTLATLLEMFTGSRLENLLSQSNPDSKDARLLADYIRTQDKALQSVRVMIATITSTLKAQPELRLLFSEDARAPGMQTLIAKGRCLVIEAPEDSTGSTENAVICAWKATIENRYYQPREAKQAGLVFALSDVNGYLRQPMARLLAQSRSARCAMLMTAPDIESLKRSQAGEMLLDNVWNQVHFNPDVPELLRQLAVSNGPSKVALAQPGSLKLRV